MRLSIGWFPILWLRTYAIRTDTVRCVQSFRPWAVPTVAMRNKQELLRFMSTLRPCRVRISLYENG